MRKTLGCFKLILQ